MMYSTSRISSLSASSIYSSPMNRLSQPLSPRSIRKPFTASPQALPVLPLLRIELRTKAASDVDAARTTPTLSVPSRWSSIRFRAAKPTMIAMITLTIA